MMLEVSVPRETLRILTTIIIRAIPVTTREEKVIMLGFLYNLRDALAEKAFEEAQQS